MNRNLKDEWVAALRSGEYEQGTEYLNQEDCFCVMGVLVDIAGIDEWVEDPDNEGVYGITEVYDGDVNGCAVLRMSVCSDEIPSASLGVYGISPHQADKLMRMNDGGEADNNRRYLFNELADYIEANL